MSSERSDRVSEHEYAGWADGEAHCTCGRTFDSVQAYETHIGYPPAAPQDERGA